MLNYPHLHSSPNLVPTLLPSLQSISRPFISLSNNATKTYPQDYKITCYKPTKQQVKTYTSPPPCTASLLCHTTQPIQKPVAMLLHFDLLPCYATDVPKKSKNLSKPSKKYIKKAKTNMQQKVLNRAIKSVQTSPTLPPKTPYFHYKTDTRTQRRAFTIKIYLKFSQLTFERMFQ
ncbi:hypothetical protein RYX36_000812 [Vicia faba]